MNAADAAPLTTPPGYATGQTSGAVQPPRRASRRTTSFWQRRICEKYLTVPDDKDDKYRKEEGSIVYLS